MFRLQKLAVLKNFRIETVCAVNFGSTIQNCMQYKFGTKQCHSFLATINKKTEYSSRNNSTSCSFSTTRSDQKGFVGTLEHFRQSHDLSHLPEFLKQSCHKTYLNESLLDELSEFLSNHIELLNKTSIASIPQSLSDLGFQYEAQQPMFQCLIHQITRVEGYSNEQLSLIFKGLSLTGFKVNRMPAELKICFFQFLSHNLFNVEPREFSNIVYYLSQMTDKWHYIPSELQQIIFDNMHNTCEGYNSQDFSNLIFSLAKMDVLWTDIPVEIQQQLIVCLETVQDNNYQEVANSIYALGKMQYDITSATNESIQDVIYSMIAWILSNNKNMDTEDTRHAGTRISNIFRGMAGMNLKYERLPGDIQISIQKVLETKLLQYKAKNIVHIIHSLGNMSTAWTALTPITQNQIQYAIQQKTRLLCGHFLTQLLIGMTGMHIQYTDMVVETRYALFEGLVLRMSGMTNVDFGKTLYALGQFPFYYHNNAIFRDTIVISTLNTTLIHKLSKQVTVLNSTNTKISERIAYEDLASILYGLAHMRVDWDKLDNTLRDAIHAAVLNLLITVRTDLVDTEGGLRDAVSNNNQLLQPLSTVFYALSLLSCQWSQLPSAIQDEFTYLLEGVVEYMHLESLADTLFALTMLTFDTADPSVHSTTLLPLHSACFTALTKVPNVDTMSVDTSDKLGVYLEFINTLAQLQDSSTERRNSIDNVNLSRLGANTTDDKQKQAFHTELLKILQGKSKSYAIKYDFSGLKNGVYPMDYAIFHGKKLIAVVELVDEVKSITKREKLLKTYLYAQRFPGMQIRRMNRSDLNTMEEVKKSAVKLSRVLLK